jgi:adhesin transport system outer membrane protein
MDHLRRDRRSSAGRAIGAFALGGLLAAAPAATARADGLSLADAVRRALAEGRAARIARLQAERSQEALGQLQGAYLPQLSLGSGAGYSNRDNEKLRAVDAQGREKVYGLTSLGSDRGWFNVYLDQLLFDLRRWRTLEREELATEAARVQESRDREQVAYDVTRQFATLVRLQRDAERAQQTLDDARRLDQEAAALFGSGRLLAVERERAALNLEQAELETHEQEARIQEARAALWSAMGGAPGGEGGLVLAPDSLPTPHAPSGAPSAEDVADSPELRVLELREEMEQKAVSAANARRYPTLGLHAGYTNYGPRRYDLYGDEARVGIDLELPLFDGFQTDHAVAEATKNAEIARLQYRSLLEQKQRRVSELRRLLEAADAKLSLAERRAKAAREEQRIADLNLHAQRGRLVDALAARERATREALAAGDAWLGRIDLWAQLQLERGRLAASILGDAAPPAAPAP